MLNGSTNFESKNAIFSKSGNMTGLLAVAVALVLFGAVPASAKHIEASTSLEGKHGTRLVMPLNSSKLEIEKCRLSI